MGMQLTEENYYSDIANYEYMSVSQFKDFNGTYGRVACEEAALAKLKGEYAQASSTALMVGSYVDRYFEGTLVIYITAACMSRYSKCCTSTSSTAYRERLCRIHK